MTKMLQHLEKGPAEPWDAVIPKYIRAVINAIGTKGEDYTVYTVGPFFIFICNKCFKGQI